MRHTPPLLALCLAALLGTTPALAEGDDPLLATVNGVELHQSDRDQFFANLAPELKGITPEQALEEMISRTLMLQYAEAEKLDQESEMADTLKRYHDKLVVTAALGKVLQESPPTQEEIDALYEQYKPKLAQVEFLASHILVKTYDEAHAVVQELQGGADFHEVAKAKSIGPTAKEGGSLGWFDAKRMVPEFAQALSTLNRGEYTVDPLETKFGWHIVLLEDTRSHTPSVEEVADKLRPLVERQRTQDYIAGLRKKARVVIKAAN